MDKKKSRFNIAYQSSIIFLFVIVVLLGSGCALLIQYLAGWSFSLTGTWIECIGFLVFAWSWASPNPIIAWSGSGIDVHPKNKNEVLLPAECKNYYLWKQPNRLKWMAAIAILFAVGLLQAIDQTFNSL